jgi:hypothetical protein
MLAMSPHRRNKHNCHERRARGLTAEPRGFFYGRVNGKYSGLLAALKEKLDAERGQSHVGRFATLDNVV